MYIYSIEAIAYHFFLESLNKCIHIFNRSTVLCRSGKWIKATLDYSVYTESQLQVCEGQYFTRERVDWVKLEAEPISRQFESGDADLGEEVVELLGNLWAQSEGE